MSFEGVFELNMERPHSLTATFRQPFDLLAITNTTWQRERPRELIQRPSSSSAPHTGQSSQLCLAASHGNAQFLPILASAVIGKAQELQKGPEAAPQWTIFATCCWREQRKCSVITSSRMQTARLRGGSHFLGLSPGPSSAIPLPDWQVDSPAWSGQ